MVKVTEEDGVGRWSWRWKEKIGWRWKKRMGEGVGKYGGVVGGEKERGQI